MSGGGATRRAARIAATQALYEMEVGGRGLTETLAEFDAYWIGREVEGVQIGPTDARFFRDLVSGVVETQSVIDPLIDTALSDGWPLKRLDAVVRAILRAGAYEVRQRRDVPVAASISAYVDVAKTFFEGDEPGLVNAVLDTVARGLRPDEMSARAG